MVRSRYALLLYASGGGYGASAIVVKIKQSILQDLDDMFIKCVLFVLPAFFSKKDVLLT